MHANQLMLRCYAKRTNEGTWYATCIDLNIDAEADSIPDVNVSLERAMIGYLETVIDADDRPPLKRCYTVPLPGHVGCFTASPNARIRFAAS